MRVVSLLPSATEIVFALGAGDELVGRSPECDYPPEARDVPVVSRNLIDPTVLSSHEIDRAVTSHLGDGGSLYHVDEAALHAARPDVILTQALCEVCAASLNDVVAVASKLDHRPDIVSLDPTDLRQVFEAIVRVGERLGRRGEADALAARLSNRVEEVERRTAALEDRPRTFCVEWVDPIFNAGHWVPDMVESAGGHDGLARAGEPSVALPWSDVVRYAPEVLVVMPCGFDVDRAAKEAKVLAGLPGWRDLPAVRRNRVFAVDGSSYFSRPGPRLADGVEILASILHPRWFARRGSEADVRPVAV